MGFKISITFRIDGDRTFPDGTPLAWWPQWHRRSFAIAPLCQTPNTRQREWEVHCSGPDAASQANLLFASGNPLFARGGQAAVHTTVLLLSESQSPQWSTVVGQVSHHSITTFSRIKLLLPELQHRSHSRKAISEPITSHSKSKSHFWSLESALLAQLIVFEMPLLKSERLRPALILLICNSAQSMNFLKVFCASAKAKTKTI